MGSVGVKTVVPSVEVAGHKGLVGSGSLPRKVLEIFQGRDFRQSIALVGLFEPAGQKAFFADGAVDIFGYMQELPKLRTRGRQFPHRTGEGHSYGEIFVEKIEGAVDIFLNAPHPSGGIDDGLYPVVPHILFQLRPIGDIQFASRRTEKTVVPASGVFPDIAPDHAGASQEKDVHTKISGKGVSFIFFPIKLRRYLPQIWPAKIFSTKARRTPHLIPTPIIL